MFKIAAFATLAYLTRAAEERLCKEDEFYHKNIGCVPHCRSKQFEKCNTNDLPTQSKGNFCGVSKTGKLESFSKKCHACLMNGFIGAKKGDCASIENQHKAEQERKRQEKQKNGNNRGSGNNESSDRGNGTNDTDRENKIHKHTCNIKRDNICPRNVEELKTIQTCGVSDDDKYINFTRPCKACEDQRIQYYYRATCSEVKQLLQEQKNSKGNKAAVDHRNEDNTCFDDGECKNYQYCKNKHCYDKCDTLKCDHGCKKGKCLPKSTQ